MLLCPSSLRCIACLLCFLFLLPDTKAQLTERYDEASIVLKSGEMLKGFVKDDELKEMNDYVFFKKEKKQDKPESYKALLVSRILFANGEIYENLRYKPFYKRDSVQVLGKLILRGKASVYEAHSKLTDFMLIIVRNNVTYPLQKDELEQNATELKRFFFQDFLWLTLENEPSFRAKTKNMEFSKSNIIKIVSEYNLLSNGQNELVSTKKEKTTNFLIADIGGMYKNADKKEFFVHAIYRIYYPKWSKSTSLNLGINYYYFASPFQYADGTTGKYTGTLISSPVQCQQNLLNESVRPYLFLGFNVSYIQAKDSYGEALFQNAFQNNFGFNILYGGGIESEVYKKLRVKAEYRRENFQHMFLAGVGYNFSK